MASLSYKNGQGLLQFIDKNGERQSIRLGKMAESRANAIKHKIEDIVNSSTYGQPMQTGTMAWLNDIDLTFYNKLAKRGLVKPRGTAKLKPFILEFIAKHTGKKTTKDTHHRVKRYLVEFFGAQRDMRDIDTHQANQWFQWMLKERPRPLVENTARKSVNIARQFWKSAIAQDKAELCPFGELSGSVRSNPKRQYFVTEEETQIVLNACPDDEWRLLFAMARYGGLRIPSEIQNLQCSAINLNTGMMTIHATKTEHNDDGGIREVPIFEELLPYLLPMLNQAQSPDDYLLPNIRTYSNPWVPFKRIVKSSGLKPWPKLLQNLRATRETELMAKFSLQAACRWIGNSPAVAMKHYAMVRDTEIFKAIAPALQKALQHGAAKRCNEAQKKESPNLDDSLNSLICRILQRHAPQYKLVQIDSNGPYRT